ncbi:MAG: CerR family C-terminal domain-containing protein [Deferrisoma sp.]
MVTQRAEPGTRARLLEAAERVFAEKGYRGATVREITRAAGANVAAVHYHFGGKKPLYLELFRERIERLARVREAALAQARGRDPVEDLRTVVGHFVRAWIERILDEERRDRGRFPLLVMREVGDPGPAYPLLLERILRPNHEAFRDLILRARPELGEEGALLAAASLMGQVIHFLRGRRVLEDLLGRAYDGETVDRICDHVTRFTLRGLGVEP